MPIETCFQNPLQIGNVCHVHFNPSHAFSALKSIFGV